MNLQPRKQAKFILNVFCHVNFLMSFNYTYNSKNLEKLKYPSNGVIYWNNIQQLKGSVSKNCFSDLETHSWYTHF